MKLFKLFRLYQRLLINSKQIYSDGIIYKTEYSWMRVNDNQCVFQEIFTEGGPCKIVSHEAQIFFKINLTKMDHYYLKHGWNAPWIIYDCNCESPAFQEIFADIAKFKTKKTPIKPNTNRKKWSLGWLQILLSIRISLRRTHLEKNWYQITGIKHSTATTTTKEISLSDFSVKIFVSFLLIIFMAKWHNILTPLD